MMAPALTVGPKMGTGVSIPAPSGAWEPADPT